MSHHGPGYCDCKPLDGDPLPTPDTLVCSVCGFVAELEPDFCEQRIPESEMRRVFSHVWSRDARAAYKYLFDLMKPVEKKPLQASTTAFMKVNEWLEKGLIQ